MVVAITLVSEARSYRVLSVTAGAPVAQSVCPYPRSATSRPCRPTASAAPGLARSAMAAPMIESSRGTSVPRIPIAAGAAGASTGGTTGAVVDACVVVTCSGVRGMAQEIGATADVAMMRMVARFIRKRWVP